MASGRIHLICAAAPTPSRRFRAAGREPAAPTTGWLARAPGALLALRAPRGSCTSRMLLPDHKSGFCCRPRLLGRGRGGAFVLRHARRAPGRLCCAPSAFAALRFRSADLGLCPSPRAVADRARSAPCNGGRRPLERSVSACAVLAKRTGRPLPSPRESAQQPVSQGRPNAPLAWRAPGP